MGKLAPLTTQGWPDTYAISHVTLSVLLLVGILANVSSVTGNLTIKLFYSWREKGNLFVVCFVSSGMETRLHGCVLPQIFHLETLIDQYIRLMKHCRMASSITL